MSQKVTPKIFTGRGSKYFGEQVPEVLLYRLKRYSRDKEITVLDVKVSMECKK